MKPTVGILIPTYNRLEMLREALASALNQRYSDIEIIVIDNGSNDGTKEMMAAITNPRVRYVVNESNLGPIGSFNRGIRLFSPQVEWCTILPDDDVLDLGFVASMASFVECYAVNDIIHGHKVIIDAVGKKIRDAASSPFEESATAYIHNRSRFRRETFITGIYFSRLAFEAIGGYPQFTTGMASDDSFIFALASRDRLYYNADAVVSIREHQGAISREIKQIADHVRAVSEFGEYVMAVAVAGSSCVRELHLLQTDLKRYMRHLNSELWLRNFLYLVNDGPDNHMEDLAELYLLTDHGFSFSLRISCDVHLARRYGWFSEKYLLYRLLWGLIQKVARIVY